MYIYVGTDADVDAYVLLCMYIYIYVCSSLYITSLQRARARFLFSLTCDLGHARDRARKLRQATLIRDRMPRTPAASTPSSLATLRDGIEVKSFAEFKAQRYGSKARKR